jgi:hypothetical protein
VTDPTTPKAPACAAPATEGASPTAANTSPAGPACHCGARCAMPPHAPPHEAGDPNDPAGQDDDPADDGPIPDVVDAPPMALNEFEFHTKNALAVGILATNDRRALGAMGYFAVEVASLRPMFAWGLNNLHRQFHGLARSGVRPQDVVEAIVAALASGGVPVQGPKRAPGRKRAAPSDASSLAGVEEMVARAAGERGGRDDAGTAPHTYAPFPVEAPSATAFAAVRRYDLPDAFVAEIAVPPSVAADDLAVLQPRTVCIGANRTVTVGLARPPASPAEDALGAGIGVTFDDDAEIHKLTATLAAGVLTLRVPREYRLRVAVGVPSADPSPSAPPAHDPMK